MGILLDYAVIVQTIVNADTLYGEMNFLYSAEKKFGDGSFSLE